MSDENQQQQDIGIGMKMLTICSQCMQQLSEPGVPVIASGGVTTLADLEKLQAAAQPHPLLNGAIIGRALYEGTLSLPAALQLLRDAQHR